MLLKETVRSYTDINRVFGRAGEKVTLISTSGEMAVVDNGKERFATRLTNLTEEPVEVKKETLQPKIETKQPTKSTATKKVDPQQKELF